MSFIVAIDGPAGSGKGTVTKKVAKLERLTYLDTGALYRAVTLEMLNRNINLEEQEKIIDFLKDIKIEFKMADPENIVLLNDMDVTSKIRSKEVTEKVSQVSSIKEVRYRVNEIEKQIAKKGEVILEGRDIGTCVFPNADVKIYLDADLEERAKRRFKENQEKGIDTTYEEVLANFKLRDENDKNKEYGALKKADDAVLVDSTNLSIDEVVEKIKKIIDEKRKKEPVKKVKKIPFKKTKRKIVKAFLHFLYIVIFRIKKVGENNIEDNGAYILCGNHLNTLDAVAIVVSTKRKIDFIGKSELFENRFLNWLGNLFDVISVKRGKQDVESMKKSLKVINSGEILGLFPEGTRKGLEKQEKVKNGAAYMALRTNTKVIPVGIQGSFKPFTKVILNYGKPLDFGKYASKNPEKEVLDKVTKEIMDNIIRLTKEKN